MVDGELEAPKTDEPKIETRPGEGERKEGWEARPGSIPLMGATVRAPLRLTGRLMAENSGYAGFYFTEEELADITMAIEELNIYAPALAQAVAIIGAALLVRGVGFVAWRRDGRPGDIRKRKEEFEKPPKTEGLSGAEHKAAGEVKKGEA